MTYNELKDKLEELTKKYGIQFWADVNKDYTAIQLKRGYQILDLAYYMPRVLHSIACYRWRGSY